VRPLVVAALPAEIATLPDHVARLHLGVGKVAAATTLAHHLAGHRDEVEVVVNLGTAGALRDQPIGQVAEVARVHQHDFDHAGVERFVGAPLPGGPIAFDVAAPGAVRLATGDRLVVDPAERARLAVDADLVDMEGYAVAATCRRFGVPVRLVKAVSDGADAGAEVSWKQALARCAVALAAWCEEHDLLR
jgi:adenosylhomocysteine nucleosidase